MKDASHTSASIAGTNHSDKDYLNKTGLIIWCITMGFVLSFLFSVVDGLRQATITAGNDPLSLVVDKLATAEHQSHFSPEETQTVIDYLYHLAPNLTFSSETLTPHALTDGYEQIPMLNIRGVSDEALLLRDASLLDGRWFSPDSKELVVGRLAWLLNSDLSIGEDILLAQDAWRIVGVFNTHNPYFDNEVWGPVKSVQTAMIQTDSYQSIYFPALSENLHNHLRDVYSEKLTRDINVISFRNYLKIEQADTFKWALLIAVILLLLVFSLGVFGVIKLANREVVNALFMMRNNFSLPGAIVGVVAGGLGCMLAYLLLNGELLSLGQSMSTQSIYLQMTVSICFLTMCLTSIMGLMGWRYSH